MAVPQMPLRWMWRGMRSWLTAGSRRLSRGLRRRCQLGFDAEGERDVLARDVAAAQADGDGAVEAFEER